MSAEDADARARGTQSEEAPVGLRMRGARCDVRARRERVALCCLGGERPGGVRTTRLRRASERPLFPIISMAASGSSSISLLAPRIALRGAGRQAGHVSMARRGGRFHFTEARKLRKHGRLPRTPHRLKRPPFCEARRSRART